MKKIVIWLICALLLTGCQAALPTEPEEMGTVPVTEPTVTEPLPTETEPAPTETLPVPTEPVIDDAAYEILRLDQSVRNESDEVIILFYYDQVILDGGDAFPEINRIIRADGEAFLEEIDIAEMMDWAEQMRIGSEFPFLCNVTAEVVHNADGVFSIRLTRDWYAGGVRNTDDYGMTFDLREDRAVTIAELFPEEEDVIIGRLKTLVWAELVEIYGENASMEMWDKLQAYEAEDFLFYIRDGELILTFPTYTFGAGADGSLTVATGQYIGK